MKDKNSSIKFNKKRISIAILTILFLLILLLGLVYRSLKKSNKPNIFADNELQTIKFNDYSFQLPSYWQYLTKNKTTNVETTYLYHVDGKEDKVIFVIKKLKVDSLVYFDNSKELAKNNEYKYLLVYSSKIEDKNKVYVNNYQRLIKDLVNIYDTFKLNKEITKEVEITEIPLNNDYLLSKSDTELLVEGDIKDFDNKKLRLAFNEIYARHGYIFKSSDLDSYFRSKAWYNPLYDSSSFDESVLSNIEKDNIKFIKSYIK